MNNLYIPIILMFFCSCGNPSADINLADAENRFPMCIEYLEEEGAELDPATLDDLSAHGFNRIFVRHIESGQAEELVRQAEERGFRIELMTHGYELYDRYSAPAISVYDPAYPAKARESFEKGLADLKKIARGGYVYPYQDEPFHVLEYLDYSAHTRAEFRRRYGYEMPGSFEEACRRPKTQLDFLNFQADVFRDGWLQCYAILKEMDPQMQIAITHDSHNVYGSGVHSNSRMAIDDIYQWGGEYADLFVYDIYPYLTFDYRYGAMGRLRKPRMSQLHYTMAQMRNMTTAYGKKMGFWVGTYNPNWFVRFHGRERQEQYWSEREVAYTAIANGCDYLISPSYYKGNNLPVDSAHWESYGEGMKVIQKVGGEILDAPKVKANACFLFPRTQHLLLQEEYYNVGVAYELFLRAFGELDILHEEQVTDETLNGYRALVMCDVSLLPVETAGHIARFVENGGIVIADCVPQYDENREPLTVMRDLFGVERAETRRIERRGQWVPFAAIPQKMSFPPVNGVEDTPAVFDRALGSTPQGEPVEFKVTSPREIGIREGRTILSMQSGIPALTVKETGKGKAYLFGFCLQDTYFQTYAEYDEHSRGDLSALVTSVFRDAGVTPHIHSSNPDIEAGLRAGEETAFVFVINHETHLSETTVTLSGLEFPVGMITDVATGKKVSFRRSGPDAVINLEVPYTETKLLKITR